MGESQKKRRKHTTERAELVAYARKVRNCFANPPNPQSLFEPERDVATEILAIMDSEGLPDTSAVASLLESLDNTVHYDGSGWLDFQMAVGAWIAAVEGRRS